MVELDCRLLMYEQFHGYALLDHSRAICRLVRKTNGCVRCIRYHVYLRQVRACNQRKVENGQHRERERGKEEKAMILTPLVASRTSQATIRFSLVADSHIDILNIRPQLALDLGLNVSV